MKIDLSDKTALVTGGSRGIGKEIAVQLAGAGAMVIVNYNRSSDQADEVRESISRSGGHAVTVKADISDEGDIKSMFEHIGSQYGHLDILVNNAGIIKDNLVPGMTMKEWDNVLNTNLRGAFMCTRQAAGMMMALHSGKIINISSISAIRGGRGQANYAAAKGALVSFTRACAVELAPKGIQVNAVMPGMIATDMSKRVRKRAGDRILERIPAARFGEPSDVAGIVVFLASEAADYITGQAVSVDGGMSIA